MYQYLVGLDLFFSPLTFKGVVTSAIVKMSNSFAILAITGVAPVPVPPPIPAVINNTSGFSSKIFVIISFES